MTPLMLQQVVVELERGDELDGWLRRRCLELAHQALNDKSGSIEASRSIEPSTGEVEVSQ